MNRTRSFRLSLLVTCCAVQAVAEPAGSPTVSSAVLQKNKQVVQQIYEVVINERKLERTAELVSPDYVGPQGERGPGGFNANIQGLTAGFPDIRFRIEDLLVEGDRVVVRWAWTGTHSGAFRGIAPTGRRVSTTGIVLYQLRDGKVVRNWLENDRLGILQQLGVVPQNFGPAAPGGSRSSK